MTANNEPLTFHLLDQLYKLGVKEICVCPGSRNAPLVLTLADQSPFKLYQWHEERSAAFFAIGRARLTCKPVAVICTSGSAVGELLPAVMEAYYSGDPLVLLTADRPRRFRGKGTPQSAEQVGIFSYYAKTSFDLEGEETCDLSDWDRRGPLHLNACFEEPARNPFERRFIPPEEAFRKSFTAESSTAQLDRFLTLSKKPLVIVSHLKTEAANSVVKFLSKLNAPVYLEGSSHIRERSELQEIRIISSENLWANSSASGYPIDGVLRIGGVPTIRLWRDLEDLEGKIHVCSINEMPFSGLSWAGILATSLSDFFEAYTISNPHVVPQQWMRTDRHFVAMQEQLYQEEPHAEPTLVHELSKLIPKGSHIFLGNSLPVREWDLAATNEEKNFQITISRGVNGIDGQISTFLGLCRSAVANWAIIGDLTALYDLAGPWILPQLIDMQINLVVMNNSGGQIFSRMYPHKKEFINAHAYRFEHFAKLWNMHYMRWAHVPPQQPSPGLNLIEVVPDEAATTRFWDKFSTIKLSASKERSDGDKRTDSIFR